MSENNKLTEIKEKEDNIEKFKEKVGELQRKLNDLKMPVIIMIEGNEESKKEKIINRFMLQMDWRSYEFYDFSEKTDISSPSILKSMWNRTPKKGHISVFCNVLKNMCEKNHIKNQREKLYKDIDSVNEFEKMMKDDNFIILKFYLLDCNNDKDTKKYKEWKKLLKVNSEHNQWALIKYRDVEEGKEKIYGEFIQKCEESLSQVEECKSIDYEKEDNKLTNEIVSMSNEIEKKEEVFINKSSSSNDKNYKFLDEETYKKELKKYSHKLEELQKKIIKNNSKVIIIYEGLDAAGKGGNIKRIAKNISPKIYKIEGIIAPTEEEREFHYLKRFWGKLSESKNIIIFDRSWYGRVLVERVEKYCHNYEWMRAYNEINIFEKQLIEEGYIVIKFWINVDKEEQLKRFEERMKDPNKRWKITNDDWKNRSKWNAYREAAEEMILKTSTKYAPWIIINGNDKKFARIEALKHLIRKLKKYE